MGVIAPMTPWIPEDDLLLKNSIEAGASLESLAKGAVQFSRRFTVGELQERWHSLLYDPVISNEASGHMLELQNAAPDISLKSERLGASKEKERIHKKRKEKSVRSHYYGMRKRVCTEPCRRMDLSFLAEPNLQKGSGNGECQEQLILISKHPDGSYPTAADFVSDFDIVRHAFPHMAANTSTTNVASTAHAFHYGHRDSFEEDIPDEIMGRDCMYGFEENVTSFSINDAVGNNVGYSFDQNNVQKAIPLIEHNLSSFDNDSSAQEIEPIQELHVSAYGSIADNQETVCPGLLPVLDSSASCEQIGYSSDVPIDDRFGEKDKGVVDPSAVPHDDNNDAKKVIMSGHSVGVSRTQSEERKPDDGLAGMNVIAEGGLLDVSHSPLNFTHEEVVLFMNGDGKDMMEDKSSPNSLNSIFPSSPFALPQNIVSAATDPLSVTLKAELTVTDVACNSELDTCEPLQSGKKDCDSVATPTLTTQPNTQLPELRDGVVCCMLNMEDPEIPGNDDIFCASQMPQSLLSSALQNHSKGSGSVAKSNKSLFNKEKASEQGLNLVNQKEETPGNGIPCKVESQLVHDSIKSVSLKGDSEIPGQCISGSSAQHSIVDGESKKDLRKGSELGNSLERKVHVSECTKNQIRKCSDASQQDADVSVMVPSSTEQSSLEILKNNENPSISDHEEEISEDDDYLPSFSDIEAMIYDMDLAPPDQDRYLSKEVSMYQCDESKKALIRLEEGAGSCMQRALSSHKAFAVLYGSHVKHYIKKPKVLLGRAAEGVTVDIDLRREGRANKISRRQAIMKMEQDGFFYLTNLGKCSILVNSKEVPGGHCLKLSSSSLIEIRSMRFLFEVNQDLVREYLAKNAKKPNKERVASLHAILKKGYHHK